MLTGSDSEGGVGVGDKMKVKEEGILMLCLLGVMVKVVWARGQGWREKGERREQCGPCGVWVWMSPLGHSVISFPNQV